MVRHTLKLQKYYSKCSKISKVCLTFLEHQPKHDVPPVRVVENVQIFKRNRT